MKKVTLVFLLLLTTACQEVEEMSLPISPVKATCGDRPQQELNRNNVQEVTLNEQFQTLSGNLASGESVGYLFIGDQGQKLEMPSNEEFCVWVIAPDTQIIEDSPFPLSGNYILQISPKSGGSDYAIDVRLDIPQENFSQEKAVNIVRQWYESKPIIFAPPFDKDIVDKFATGDLYDRTLVEKNGGSVGWLKNNNCYYIYDYSKVNNINSFSNTEEKPVLDVSVSEKLKIDGSTRACGTGGFKSYTKNVTYWFEKDDGIWKIYDYKVGN